MLDGAIAATLAACVIVVAVVVAALVPAPICPLAPLLRTGLRPLSARCWWPDGGAGECSCWRAALRHLLPHLLAVVIFCMVSWVRFRSELCFQRLAAGWSGAEPFAAVHFLKGLELGLVSVELEEVVVSS
uniref:(northern house mosquito) hypothetical protein n=1 Tax=Culex pipiens TaxID=7175 RepID=A0A8D8CZS1_CULPI